MANAAFISPEICNDYVLNLGDEHVFSSEFCYQYQNAWVHANVNAYYSRLDHVTEWQNFYNDDENSFTYLSMTGLEKEYYGIEQVSTSRWLLSLTSRPSEPSATPRTSTMPT